MKLKWSLLYTVLLLCSTVPLLAENLERQAESFENALIIGASFDPLATTIVNGAKNTPESHWTGYGASLRFLYVTSVYDQDSTFDCFLAIHARTGATRWMHQILEIIDNANNKTDVETRGNYGYSIYGTIGPRADLVIANTLGLYIEVGYIGDYFVPKNGANENGLKSGYFNGGGFGMGLNFIIPFKNRLICETGFFTAFYGKKKNAEQKGTARFFLSLSSEIL
jgi:hypothetical protein